VALSKGVLTTLVNRVGQKPPGLQMEAIGGPRPAKGKTAILLLP
jgi:hypothetical protein